MAILPILLSLVVGVTAGVLRRGRLDAMARTRVRHLELLAVALGAAFFVEVTDVGPTAAIAVLGLGAGLTFTVVNVHLVGMAIVSIGVCANLSAVALNGAMPVRPEALVEAEMVTVDELDRVTLDGARELSDETTLLPALGDTYPVRWTGQVLSIGDLIMLVGVADVVANLMLQRRRRRLPAGALASLEALGLHEEPDGTIELRDPVGPPTVIDLRDTPPTDDPAGEDQPAPASTTASPAHD